MTGGSYTWPIWMIHHILEQISNGTPPSAISPNIAYQATLAMPGVKVIAQELPRINFICSCQKILRIIGDILVVYRIVKVEIWDQLISDGMFRRLTTIKNLIIDVIDEKCLCSLIISTSMILKGETSDQKVVTVLSTITG